MSFIEIITKATVQLPRCIKQLKFSTMEAGDREKITIHNIEDLPAEKLFQLAEEKNEEMQTDDARYYYEQAFNKDPSNDIYLLCFADFLKQNDQSQTAISLLTTSLQSRPDGSYKRYFQLAELHDGVKSIQIFEKGIAAAQSINLKEYNMFRAPQLSEAELRRDIANAYAAIAEVCMTDLLEEKEAEGKCVEALKKGAEVDPSCMDVVLQTANYMMFKDDTDGARSKLLQIYQNVKKGDEGKPAWEESYSNELKTQTAKYLLEVENYNESIELLNMVNQTGKDQQILYLLAFCHFKAKNYADSLDLLDEYDAVIKEGAELDEEVSEAAHELREELNKLDPKLFEEPNDTGVEGNDDEWMDIE